jgi:hypothetical protein
MATYDELIDAARRADAAGDAAGAKRFLELAKNLKSSFPARPVGGSTTNPQAVGEFRDKGRAMASAIANGASFGFGDNLAGIIEGGKEALQGRSFGRGYEYGTGVAREGMAADAAANPGMTMTGNLMGAAVPALLAAPLASGGSILGTSVRGLGLGALEGGLQGAGNADGQDVIGRAIRGAVIGGAAGGAAPAIVGAVGAVKNAVMDPVSGVFDSMVGRANVGKANRAMGSALRDSGKTEQDIIDAITRATAQGQPEYRIMDALGVAGQRQASGVARAGGDAGREIAEFLERRQLDQGDRIGGFIDDAFGTRGTTAAQTRGSLTTARGQAADAAYGAARGNAAPVDVRGALGVIDARLGPMAGSGVAGDGIDGTLSRFRSRLASQPGGPSFPGASSVEMSDFDRVLGVKQDLQDAIGAAVRAGRNNEARELGKLQAELDAALEASSDGYRAANDGFRDASRVIDAVDTGAGMATRGRAADNVPAFSAMPAPQQDAARIGYGDTLLNRLEAVTAPTANRAKPLLSTKRTMEADAMTLDPSLYRDRLGRENEMWATQNRALGGSRTADNLQDINAMEGLAGGALDVARSAGNFQFGDVVAKIGGLLGPIARGQTDQTRQLIARMLMSNDPAAALAPVLRQQNVSDKTRRAIEAIIRQPMREGGEAASR